MNSSFFQNARISTNPTQYHLILLMEEILRSPVEVGSLSHHLQGFIHPRWLAGFLWEPTKGAISSHNGMGIRFSEVNLPRAIAGLMIRAYQPLVSLKRGVGWPAINYWKVFGCSRKVLSALLNLMEFACEKLATSKISCSDIFLKLVDLVYKLDIFSFSLSGLIYMQTCLNQYNMILPRNLFPYI